MKLGVQLKLLIVCAFLPNIVFFSGVKTLDICLIFLIIYNTLIKREYQYTLQILNFTAVIFLSIVLFTFSTLISTEFIDYRDFFASFSRIFRILLMIILFNYYKIIEEDDLKSSLNLFIMLVFLNSILAILEFTGVNIQPLKEIWIQDYYNSVAYNSNTNSRFLGIINQPLEAGFSYSLALLSIIGFPFINIIRNVFFALFITLGGFISGSKVIIFLGLPLAILLMFKKGKSKISLIILIISIGLILSYVKNKYFGDKYYFIETIFESLLYSGNFFDSLSGGRIEEKDLNMMVEHVFKSSPIWGFGFGSTKLMDSGLMEFFYQGGFLGLFLYFFVLLIIFLRIRKIKINREFYIAFSVLVLLSSFGAPILTMSYSLVPMLLVYKYLK
jgi:hypothetical protein